MVEVSSTYDDVDGSSEKLLNRREAAFFLTGRGYKTSPNTLAKLASIGGGPIFISFGKKPLYRPSNLLSWAKSRCTGPRRSTSDTGSQAA